jgi:hypothetical protein
VKIRPSDLLPGRSILARNVLAERFFVDTKNPGPACCRGF